MKQAPTRYYRNIIGELFPYVRIAFTHTPMTGVTKIDKTPIMDVLKASDDEYAQYYIEGLENNTMVTIVENTMLDDKHFKPGELYLKS